MSPADSEPQICWGSDDPDQEFVVELRRVARAPADSGRAAMGCLVGETDWKDPVR
jgi:hypothetical protein